MVMAMDINSSWDELRKQARRLENEIDVKLAGFGRTDQSEECEREIEELLEQLERTNSSMQSLITAAGSDIVSHTLARHLNIFQEFNQEFRRKRLTARESREHAALLQTFGSPRRNAEVDPFEQERRAVHRSTVQIDSVVNHAQAALGALTSQRQLFGNIGLKVNSVGAAFPSINQVLNSIRRKKNKDTLILAAVISFCTIFLFVYWVSK